jgi:hypothetical protein
MAQLLFILAVLVGISYVIGKILNKDKGDEGAAIAKGCGVLVGLVIIIIVGLFIFSGYQKRNPTVSEEKIKNDIVNDRYSYVSTLSQIKNIEILDVVRNDDLLEVQISANIDTDRYRQHNKFALKYEYSFFDHFGWDLDEIIPLNN